MNYPVMQHPIPEEQRPQLQWCTSLEPHTAIAIAMLPFSLFRIYLQLLQCKIKTFIQTCYVTLNLTLKKFKQSESITYLVQHYKLI